MKSKNGIKKYSKQLLRFCVKLVVVLLLFALHSCEKVEKPYLPFTPPPPTSDTIRKILVEDYTGHTCLNCPRAAKVLHSLESKLYPHQIIGLASASGWWRASRSPSACSPPSSPTSRASTPGLIP